MDSQERPEPPRRTTTPALPQRGARELFVGRQPILDANGRLHAFELLFRSGAGNEAVVPNAMAATARVLHDVFAELGIEKVLGPYRGFINCDAQILLERGLLDAMPCDKLVLEILEDVAPSPAVLRRCRELQQAGFQFALDDYTGGPAASEFLTLADFVKVDVLLTPDAELERLVANLARGHATLLAEKVQTREQAERCKALGFELFQGYFFARPTVIQGHRIEPSQSALLRVLAMLMKHAGPAELEQVCDQEPGLSATLLKIVNLIRTGSHAPVTSLADGIAIVGQRPLLRWMQLQLYANAAGEAAASPLLHLAATRGRWMELLANDLWPQDEARGDAAFMAGMMSLIPALLHAPLEEVLGSLQMPAEVAAALLHHEGDLGPLLESIETLEAADAAQPVLGLTDVQVGRRLAEAMAWSHEATSSGT